MSKPKKTIQDYDPEVLDLFDAYVYKGARHGFHNNSTPRYDDVAAMDGQVS